MQVNQQDTPHQEIEKWKPYDPLNRCRKCFWQNWAPIYDKTVLKVGIEETYLNVIKAIYDKPIASILLIDEKL